MTTKTNQIRRLIMSFSRRDFTTEDLPDEPSIQSMLKKLEARGEIEACGYFKPDTSGTGRRARKYYRELKIRMDGLEPVAASIDTLSAWKRVRPEFFNVPRFVELARRVYKEI